MFRFRVGLTDFVLVNDPDWIGRILVGDSERFGEGKWTQSGTHAMGDCLITREGALHRERRALLQPSFAEKRLAEHSDAMVDHALRHTDAWNDGASVDMRQEMNRLAITIAADVLFELDLRDESGEVVRALGVLLGAIPRLPLPRPRVIAARRYLHEVAARVDSGHLFDALRKAELSDAEICREIVAMLIASADTTPSTLAWIWFSLGRDADIESALHAELAAVLDGRRPTGSDISRLPGLDRIVTEALRLYPTVHFIDRRALCDVELGGVAVKAGDYLLLSPLLTQRDPRHFAEPEEFRPDRWLAGGHGRHRFAYFPFGAGPHVCIGMGLARREIALVLATIAQSWRMQPIDMPEHPSPQTRCFPMKLERRP